MTDEHKLAQKCELEGKYDLVFRIEHLLTNKTQKVSRIHIQPHLLKYL